MESTGLIGTALCLFIGSLPVLRCPWQNIYFKGSGHGIYISQHVLFVPEKKKKKVPAVMRSRLGIITVADSIQTFATFRLTFHGGLYLVASTKP